MNASAPPADRSIIRVRRETRRRLLDVAKIERPTSNLIRITLEGDDLEGFESLGFDDHVKLFIAPQIADSEGPDAVAPMRDYTPHDFNARSRTLQIDFALHDAGPATNWARRAAPGDRLLVGGPRGSLVVGTGFATHVLIGDETALPAIRRRVAELPQHARAIVLAEVEGPADEEPMPTEARLDLRWVHRTRNRLLDVVAEAELPAEDAYAWVACESAVAKALRNHLLERGFDRRAMKAAGYWARGTVAVHDVITDETEGVR